ncbi:unnamed protein product [Arabidopsis thaliana]|uniref:Ras-related small GTP-binding family protein n=2 Tax=Arabidopsis thaliana TaxID=3702 RepID=F4JGT3_ARATH|nr:Ras-related small GTP-binding family protein [Arabidopsis thaliana]AEE82570.1 Ras-related small GTP-binding family protein [Arabidopsis thaliana]VYS61948.1 unnamed protein product [Arabidopsis thaliana]|eukprot:NP_680628.1 Ras-related small GTP-binding family protein [Arabidopsis thaliana]
MEFCYESKSTISMEFQTRTITLQGKLVKDQIWESRKSFIPFSRRCNSAVTAAVPNRRRSKPPAFQIVSVE